LFDVMAGLALLIAVPMTLLSDVVIRLFYSAQYAGAGPILAIHIWAALFVFLGVAQSPWDISEGLTRLALLRTLLGAVINVAMNFVLLPLYAGLGAAISTVVAYAVSACLANALDARTRPILILQIKSLFLIRYLRRPARAS
jgi:PST family polysaccharide transporter